MIHSESFFRQGTEKHRTSLTGVTQTQTKAECWQEGTVYITSVHIDFMGMSCAETFLRQNCSQSTVQVDSGQRKQTWNKVQKMV